MSEAISPNLAQPESEIFLPVLRQATHMVPFPGLFIAEAFPVRGGGLRAGEFQSFTFAFQLANQFVARVDYAKGQFAKPTIERNRFEYNLRPIQNDSKLLDLGAALKEALAQQGSRSGTSGPDAGPRLKFSLVRLCWPMRAQLLEPLYFFVQVDTGFTTAVGAYTGKVNADPCLGLVGADEKY